MSTRKNIIKILVTTLLLAAFWPGTGFSFEDKIIAVVNGDIITLNELRDYLSSLYLRLKAQGLSDEEIQDKMLSYQNDGLKKLVEEKILLSEADRQQLIIQDKAIQSRIDELKRNFPTDKDFLDALTADGLTPTDLKKRITDDLKVKFIIEREVRGKIFVNPQEITTFYQAHKEKFIRPERVRLESIFVAKGTDRNAALDKAKKALALIKTNQDFAEVARQYSESSSLGLVTRAQLLPQIDEAALKLSPNAVSPIVEIDTGFFILKLVEKYSPELMPLEEVKDEISDTITQQKFKMRFASWLEKLESKAHIEIKGD